MKLSQLGRLAPAAALAALVGACADSPTVFAPSAAPIAFGSEVGSAGEGDLEICKVGNQRGTFSFVVSYDPRPVGDPAVMSPARPNDNVNVGVGSCVIVTNLTAGRYVATVTETAPPSFWTLTDLTVTVRSVTAVQPGFAGGPVVIDLPTRTASNIGISNDNGATVTFTNTYTPPPVGCTLTQGYWKTHSEKGPAPYDATWALLANGADTPFFLSGKSWHGVFWTAPGGNAYYNLAHQYMAASLSILKGADGSAVSAELATATTLFNMYTPAQIAALRGSNALRQQFISLAGTLDAYNNGLIGPGHCDGE